MPWPPLAPRLALLFAAAAAIGADGVASRLHLPSTSANDVTRRYVLSEAADIFDTEADNGYAHLSSDLAVDAHPHPDNIILTPV